MVIKGRFYIRLGFTGWGEDKMLAERYNYKWYFDLELLPRVRVKHNKKEWAVVIAWLCFQLDFLVMLPIFEWMVYKIDCGNTIICHHSESLIKAIWYRLKHRDTSITRYPR